MLILSSGVGRPFGHSKDGRATGCKARTVICTEPLSLMLINREEEAGAEELKHTTLATSRLRFLFLAAKVWRHAGRVGVSYRDHYAEQGIFQRAMERLRAIMVGPKGYVPVLGAALRC